MKLENVSRHIERRVLDGWQTDTFIHLSIYEYCYEELTNHIADSDYFTTQDFIENAFMSFDSGKGS